MNKRKILALAMALSMVAILAVGATLAYFTDTDRATNTFSVGGVDIVVSETNAINGQPVSGNSFDKLMPNTTITKTATVTNKSTENAYVRVVVHMDNQEELYKKILNVKNDDGSFKYAVDEIFDGWDFAFETEGTDMNYISSKTGSTGVTLFGVDEAVHSDGGGSVLMSSNNLFKTEYEAGTPVPGSDGAITIVNGRVIVKTDNKWQGEGRDWYDNPGKYVYYQDLVGLKKESAIAWIFYLEMEPNATYTLFDGINIPEEFGTDEMAFFKDLEINVCADAIQKTGFESYTEAFEALNAEHPLASWNLGARN